MSILDKYRKRATSLEKTLDDAITRMEEEKKRREEQDNREGFRETVLGIPVAKINKGSNIFRIVPLKDDFDAVPWVTLQLRKIMHPGLLRDGVQSKSFPKFFACGSNFGKQDPIEEEFAKVRQDIFFRRDITKDQKKALFAEIKDDEAQWSYYQTREQNYAFALPEGSTSINDLVCLKFGFKIREGFEKILKDKKRGGLFYDPVFGFDIDLLKEGEGKFGTSYTVNYDNLEKRPITVTLDRLNEDLNGLRLNASQWADEIFNRYSRDIESIDTFLEEMPDLRDFTDEKYHWTTPGEGLLFTSEQIDKMLSENADPKSLREECIALYEELGDLSVGYRSSPEEKKPNGISRGVKATAQPDEFSNMSPMQLYKECAKRGIKLTGTEDANSLREALRGNPATPSSESSIGITNTSDIDDIPF